MSKLDKIGIYWQIAINQLNFICAFGCNANQTIVIKWQKTACVCVSGSLYMWMVEICIDLLLLTLIYLHLFILFASILLDHCLLQQLRTHIHTRMFFVAATAAATSLCCHSLWYYNLYSILLLWIQWILNKFFAILFCCTDHILNLSLFSHVYFCFFFFLFWFTFTVEISFYSVD